MSAPEGFTRRICAVMLMDVSGYSALVGLDDERTAEVVHRLHEVVSGLVADAGGQSEVRAGDALLAAFDSVGAAVDTGLAILRRVEAERFAGTGLKVRIGIHLGDVLLRENASLNEAVGDAINIAARLEALARPGTLCVSDGVYRHVRAKRDEVFVDLGRQQLKNISDPVHAYLIVPREHASAHRPRRGRRIVWGASAALLSIAAAAALLSYRESYRGTTKPPGGSAATAAIDKRAVTPASALEDPIQQVALGVMSFRSLGDASPGDWRRDALRDGLNTQLSRLSHLKVYSKEFIDFLITRKGLTEIEAATQLGIRKMLSGSFVDTGGALQIEIHVVDVESGVLELSYTTTGSDEKFLDLQNRLVLDVISRLNLPVSDEEKQTLLAQQTTDVEALRLLLEAEGGRPAEKPTPGGLEPRSWLPDRFRWLGATAALADVGPAEAAIRDVIDRYRRAMEGREVEALARLYIEFPPDLQSAQERYFGNVRDLRVEIANLDIAVVGDEAVVSYTRTDDFTDARTGRPMHAAVRVTKVLRQVDGQWKLTAQ